MKASYFSSSTAALKIAIVVAAQLRHHDRMDAETPEAKELRPEKLSLPQAFLLLATKDKGGVPEVPAYALRTTLAGAILAELELLGAIELQGKHVRATDTAPETDLQHELELIRHKSRPHTPKRWVSMLEARAEVQRFYEGLVSLGIVEHVGEKHLGLFKTVRYPEKDHGPEAAILEGIQSALTSGTPDPVGADEPAKVDPKTAHSGTPDARTKALIALLDAAGILKKLFPSADESRIKELVSGHWPSRAVVEELLMIRLAEQERLP